MAFLQQVLTRGARASLITVTALGALALVPAPLLAAPAAPGDDASAGEAPASDDPAALRKELESEEARIRALEKRLSQDEAALDQAQRAKQQAPTANPASGGGATGPAAGAPAATGPSTTSGAALGSTFNPNTLLGTWGPDGFTLESADGLNVLRLRGNLSLDYRYFDDSGTPATADTFLVRKARPILEGTLDGMFDFRLMPDFGQGKTILQDAWVDARFADWFTPQVGKFKAPVGLERLQLEQFARFIEASLPSDLLPYRDLGFAVNGNIDKGLFTYQVGVFDGAPDGGSTDANSVPDTNSTGKFTWDVRVFSHPFALTDWSALKHLGIGISGTYVDASGTETSTTTTSLLPSYKTTGQQPLFSYRSDTSTTSVNNATIARGIERRLVPQANYYYGPFGLLGEYVKQDQQVFRQLTAATSRSGTLDNRAWQIQGYFMLTGEPETYDTLVVPRRSVPQGGWGAWELVARYHVIDFDNAAFADGANSFANPATAAQSARAIGTGINWYLTENFRLQLDYEVTRFEGGAAIGNRPDERVLTTQFALIF